MSCVTHSAFIPAPVKRLIALAGFTAALLLAAPPLPALAGTQAAAQQTRAAKRAETVEQRIAALHTALKITPAQETGWQAVAQTMRDKGLLVSISAGVKPEDHAVIDRLAESGVRSQVE